MLFLGDRKLLCKAASSKVSFNIDLTLKSHLIQQSHPKDIDISDTLKKDAHHNKWKLILHARVTTKHADFEVVLSANGQGKIKYDIIAENKSRHISLRLLNKQVSKLTYGKTYKLSHMVFKLF